MQLHRLLLRIAQTVSAAAHKNIATHDKATVGEPIILPGALISKIILSLINVIACGAKIDAPSMSTLFDSRARAPNAARATAAMKPAEKTYPHMPKLQ